MKPCSRNRKLIAWLALGALDAHAARNLQAHFETCEACRRYLEDISNVKEKLTAIEARPDLQASESFHQRLARTLKAEQSRSLGETLSALLRGTLLNWRVALPVIGASTLMIVTLSTFVRRPSVSLPAQTGAQAVLPPNLNSDLQPTIANYQMVANQSWEKLDELLTRQGNRNPSSTPVYTASSFLRANALD